jgi:hypothetical protein
VPSGAENSLSTEVAVWQPPDGTKFAMLAVETSSLPAARDGEENVGDGVRVLFRTPLTLPDLWMRWLGSLRAERFQRSNLIIIASERSERPGVVDGQTSKLETKAKEVFLGVLLQGGPFGFRSGILLSGERRGSELEVRKTTSVSPVFRVAGTKTIRLSDALIQDASRIASVLHNRVMVGGFRRLRGGFASWHGAVLEASPSERLHGFVRSLDGTMILPRGGSQRTFRQRGQVLVGRNDVNEQLLDELYVLRSATAHLNDFEDALSGYPPEGRNVTALLRAFQSELFATEVYRRILSSDELLEHMRDDESIRSLWEIDESELRRLWGSPIDLDGACRARFVNVDTGEFPVARLITTAPEGSAGISAMQTPT